MPQRSPNRPKRDCHHKRVHHEHGTVNAYVADKCRCDPCTAANRDYYRRLRKDQAYGRHDDGMTDAAPARAHVDALRAQGMGCREIADTAGISIGVIHQLLYGAPAKRIAPSATLRRDNAAAILAVQPHPDDRHLLPGNVIDGIGTIRRLRALCAIGWGINSLGEQLGLTGSAVFAWTSGRRHQRVTKGTADKVAALYDRLWDTPPVPRNRYEAAGMRRAINNARHHQWAPPMAWDDDAIDDPKGRPAPRWRPASERHRLRSEDVEWVLRADALATARQLEQRFGLAEGSVQVALRRQGRRDLLAQLARNAELAA